MKRWLQILSLLLLLPFINKVLFLESGIFAQSLYNLSMVCHCNHSSKEEVHTDVASVSTKRSTCKLAKGHGAAHQCGCAKKKSANKIVHSQSLNPNYLSESNIAIYPKKSETNFLSESNFQLAIGFSHLPFKPPRQTLLS
ncbi:hypothetical protein EHQ58_01980 [Leptospira ognonensis]|uniref:Uncharacterized protein n=1 Tax=Leptospira ognonensis TaxID=2484945 RepID=A0A4R9KAE5_9LEPT|nr:hypothetical protein [Leptospira ognonensis]TGL62941.1 hypothetical protein EHQ58_01980 [Leptospira ognonensis]